jgi:hypothetical protein
LRRQRLIESPKCIAIDLPIAIALFEYFPDAKAASATYRTRTPARTLKKKRMLPSHVARGSLPFPARIIGDSSSPICRLVHATCRFLANLSIPLAFALRASGNIWQTRRDASHNRFSTADLADLILANDVESNLVALREARTTAQATALEHLKRYVAHRTMAFIAFKRLDPDSQATRDARERLEKAKRDYEAFARSIGVALENEDVSGAESDMDEEADGALNQPRPEAGPG